MFDLRGVVFRAAYHNPCMSSRPFSKSAARGCFENLIYFQRQRSHLISFRIRTIDGKMDILRKRFIIFICVEVEIQPVDANT